MYILARTLLEDKSVTDVSSVPGILEESAKEGYVPAKLLLLDIWQGRFKGLPRDEKKAIAWAIRLTEEGSAKDASPELKAAAGIAFYRLARHKEHVATKEEERHEAFDLMQKAAKIGNRRAEAELARYYMNGIGCSPQPVEAIKLLKELTKNSPETPHVFFYLGYICQRGLGLSRPHYERAIEYYQQGVEYNDARAANNLAIMYERGISIPRDVQQALSLYQQAAVLGDKSAAANMRRLMNSLGIEEEEDDEAPFAQRLRHAFARVAEYLPF